MNIKQQKKDKPMQQKTKKSLYGAIPIALLSSSVVNAESLSINTNESSNVSGISNSQLSFVSNKINSLPYFIKGGNNLYIGKDIDIATLKGYTFSVYRENSYNSSSKGNKETVLKKIIDDKTTVLDLKFDSTWDPNYFVSIELEKGPNELVAGMPAQSMKWWGHKYTVSPITPPEYAYLTLHPLLYPKCKQGFNCGFVTSTDRKVKSRYAVHKALKNEERIGPLFVHFGGPEGSKVDVLFNSIKYFPKEVIDSFDIVAVDDIGIGYSSGGAELEACSSLVKDKFKKMSREVKNQNMDAYLGSFAAEVREKCDKVYEKYAPYAGSKSGARVWESVREKEFNGEQISILGISYGGRPAALYNNSYPEHTRAVVLDSTMGMNQNLLVDFEQIASRIGDRLGEELGLDVKKLKPIFNSIYEYGEYQPSLGKKLTTDDAIYLDALLIHGKNHELRGLAKALDKLGTNDSSIDYFKTLPNFLKSLDSIAFEQIRGKQFSGRSLLTCVDSVPYTNSDVVNRKQQFLDAGIFVGRTLFKQTQFCTDWKYKTDPIKKIKRMGGTGNALIIHSEHDSVLTTNSVDEYMSSYGENRISYISSLMQNHMIFTQNQCVTDKVVSYLKNPSVPSTGKSSAFDCIDIQNLDIGYLEQNKSHWTTLPQNIITPAIDVLIEKADFGGKAIGSITKGLKPIISKSIPNTYIFSGYFDKYTKLVVVKFRNDLDSGLLQYKADTWYADGDKTASLETNDDISENNGFIRGWERNYEIKNIKLKVSKTK
jgi:pimeloyl-ACP methyl ester carboxylesterase